MQAVVNEFSWSIRSVCNNDKNREIEDAINLLNLFLLRKFCMNEISKIRKKVMLHYHTVNFCVCLMSVCMYVCTYIHGVPKAMYVLLNWAHILKIAQTIDSNESKFSMQLQLFHQHHRCSNVKRILERIYAIWAHYLNRVDFTVFLLTCLTYFELVKSIYTSVVRLTCNCTFYKPKMLFTLSTTICLLLNKSNI